MNKIKPRIYVVYRESSGENISAHLTRDSAYWDCSRLNQEVNDLTGCNDTDDFFVDELCLEYFVK